LASLATGDHPEWLQEAKDGDEAESHVAIQFALYSDQDYEYNTSLRVIGAALCMQKSHLQKVQKLGKEKAKYVAKPRIRDTICDLFHIGHDAYSQIIGGYLHNQSIYQTGGGMGNSIARETRIPWTTAMQIKVRDFVWSHWMNRQRVTGRQVLDFLVEQKHLVAPLDLEGRYQRGPFIAASRGVQ
jgi:hypothetical protein